MQKCQIKSKNGFTLIELLVVITIIGLLASVVLASLATSRASARDASRVASVKELQKALELYRNANGGNYPCADGPICLATTPTAGNAGAQVNVNGTTRTFTAPNNFDTAIRPYLILQNESIAFASGTPSQSITTGSIWYRLGANGAAANKDSYTILLRRERPAIATDGSTIGPGDWCAIRKGRNVNTTWVTTIPKNCFSES